MKLKKELQGRSNSTCELCSSSEDLKVYILDQAKTEDLENAIYACEKCISQIPNPEIVDVNHWRCLNDCMWSEHRAVKVVVWRMLNRLKYEGWPQDLLDMMYLDDEVLEFARSAIENVEDQVVHKDANNVVLEAGDSVVLIKDLKVKGSSMVAKQGTAVRNIRLDRENAEHIEGKVDGQQIVIITKYVKKI
jgi:protein PhnA